jgi:hypothetical protein
VLDRVLPKYQVRERHEIVVTASPEVALAAALALPAAPDRLVATLFALRGLPHRGASIAVLFDRMGLDATRAPRAYAGSFSPAKGLRIAFAFWTQPHPHGARLATETRVHAETQSARARFALYWLVVGPFSALIRRRWLVAAKRAAEARL